METKYTISLGRDEKERGYPQKSMNRRVGISWTAILSPERTPCHNVRGFDNVGLSNSQLESCLLARRFV